MKKQHRIKRTISIKQFISEFGEAFSKHTKQRLLELGTRCILTRKENLNMLDLKHIEHTKYDSTCSSEVNEEVCQKEYAYGQLIMNEGNLYFSDRCLEEADVMQIGIIDDIYNHLESNNMLLAEGINAKRIDDSNIDYVIDSILTVCPEVSSEHQAIIAKYMK